MSMESWQVVGQKVCRKDNWPWLWVEFSETEVPEAKFGVVYTISSLSSDHNCIWLEFAELGTDNQFDASDFRPVRPTSIECFRSLLMPTPEQVREMESA